MKHIFTFSNLLLALFTISSSQLLSQVNMCGSAEIHEQMMLTDPQYAQRMQAFENNVQLMQNSSQKVAGVVYKVPVVVHVMHKGEAVGTGINVSEAAIKAAIKDLNEMYRKIPGSQGDGTGVDVEIEYALAVRDPSGNCTNGINRVSMTGNAAYMSNGVNRAATGGITDAALKATSVWDQTQYYNIWLISEIDNNNGGSGIQGYAYFASSHGTSVDGSVILSSNFTSGTSTTAAHEIGHSLNLYHTFEGDAGGGSCPTASNGCGSGAGDCCGDIPAHIRSASDCITGTNACDGITARDLFIHNYMEYSSDACQNMLTANQKTRMVAALTVTRASFLESNGNLSLTPVTTAGIDFSASAAVVCGVGQSVTFMDNSTCIPNSYIGLSAFTGVTHSWTITDGTNIYTSSLQNPTITFTNTGTFNVTLSVTNAFGTTSATKTGMIIINAGSPVAACTPGSNNVGNFWQTIYNTTFNTFNNTTSKYVNAAYTNLACSYNTIVTAGSTYSLSVSANAEGGNGNEVFEVYIDYNNNGVFSNPSEMIFSGVATSSTSATFTTNVTIPGTAIQNTLLRMRVIGETNTISVSERTCGVNFFIGDVEDYGVYINPIPCTSPSITSTTPSSRCGTGTLTLGATTNTGTVNWYTAATGGTAIATGTVFTTPSLTTTTTYYVDATNAGCTTPTRTAVTATINAIPVLTLTPASATLCSGQSTTLTISGASTYTWAPSGSGTSSVVSPTTTTIYTVTGTSTAGCISVPNTSTINVNTTPIVTLTPVSTTICSGQSTTLTVSGATTYTWLPSGSGTSSVLSPTIATVYTVTGTSAAGCASAPKTSTVNVNANPTTIASSSGTLTCSTLTVALNSSLAGMNYSWTPPSGATVATPTTQNTSGTGAGIYTLSVVNPISGCSYSTTTSVTQNTTTPTVTSSTSGTLTCSTLTTSAMASTTATPVLYAWTGAGIVSGATTGTVTVNQPGSYNYTVTNTSNGCKTTGAQTVMQNIAIPTISISGSQTITCAAPTVTLVGSATPSTCTPVWTGGVTTGATSYTATTSTPNTYTLTVTNPSNGCIASATTQVIPGAGLPSVSTSVTNSLSCTSVTAQVVATTTSSPVSYNWSGPGIIAGATTASATVNAGGQYTVVVTNTASACSSTVTVSVNQNTVTPSVTGTTSGILSCTVFTVNANATTTTTPVSYAWTGTGITSGASTGTVTVNQPGTFNYTVTNTSNGCIATGIRTVTQNTTSPSISISGTQTITCATSTVTLVGSATPSTCTPVWTGGVTTGATSYTATTSTPNTYTLTVTNPSNGCVASATTQVVSGAGAPSISASVTNTLSCTSVTAQVVATTTSSPVSYSWSGPGIIAGATTASATVNAGGQYTVVVTNTASACSSTVTVSVNQNTVTPSVTGTTSGILSCTVFTVNANATTTTTPVSYAWTGTGITSGASTGTVTVNQPGTFNYTVTNTSNGCTSLGIRTVTQNTTSPSVTSSATGSITCSASTANVIASTTSSPVTYNWTGSGIVSGAATATITVNQSGLYNYTVTNTTNGCSSNGSQSVSQNTVAPAFTLSPLSSSICSGSSQTLSVTTSGSNSILWSTSASTPSISVTPTITSNYSVTITNTVNGCTAANNSTVTVSTAPIITLTPTSATICSGQTTTLTASGASTYTWTPGGQTTMAIAVNPAATTNYTVIGANGTCSSSKTITINVVSTPTVVSSITNTTVCSGTPVIVSVTGATTYTWLPSGSGNTSTLTPTVTTVYNVTGSNGGCVSASKTFTVNVTTTPTVGITASSSTICTGQTVTLTANGATTYSWSPGAQTTPIITVNPAGTTSYTVIGFNGSCSSTKTISINVTATPTVVSSITNTTVCNGTSVIASVTGATTYTWLPSGSGNTSTLNPGSTTIYTVTGSSGSCVSNPKTFTITVNSNPTLSNVVTNVSCFGLCDGSMTVTASGGTGPYAYSLIQGAPVCAATTCTNLCAGAYTLNVTDMNGCTANSNITILEPSQLVASISNTNATCSNCTDGAATVFASGGTPAYSYSWMPGSQTTPSIINLAVGCYTAQVFDGNGCAATATTCISFSTKIDEVQANNIISVYPNPSNGVFTISTTFDNVEIIVINAIGQTVKTGTLQSSDETVLDMRMMSTGVYYVKASTPEGTKLFKLILQ